MSCLLDNVFLFTIYYLWYPIITDEAISNLVSSKSDLEQAVAEKDVIIEDMKTQIDGLKKDNANLELDLKDSQALKDALLEEQNKTKETQSKVTELTEFILARDETISQLKVEATKSLEVEEIKHSGNSTAETLRSQPIISSANSSNQKPEERVKPPNIKPSSDFLIE